MPVEGFDAGEEFAVVAARDQDLGVVARGSLQDRKRPVCEFVLLDQGDFVLGEVVARLVEQLAIGVVSGQTRAGDDRGFANLLDLGGVSHSCDLGRS